MKYRFLRRHPKKAYLGRDLWLPKELVNVRAIKSRLTFKVYEGRSRTEYDYICNYKDSKHHLLVPRNFMTPEEVFARYGVKVEDVRVTKFPRERVLHSIVARDYQEEPLRLLGELAKYNKDGTLNLGCGLGKTVIAIRHAAESGVPTLVLCGNASILRGWKSEIESRLTFRGDVGWIQGSTFKWEGCPIVLATVQTLYNKRHELTPEFLLHWGLVIYDEGHHMSAETFAQTANLFHGRRLALTATPKRNDGLEPIYQSHLGPVFYRDTSTDMSPTCVFVHLSGYKDRAPRRCSDDNTFLQTWLSKDKTYRHKAERIIKSYVKKGHRVIALSHRVLLLEELTKSIPGAKGIWGSIKLEEREDALLTGNPVCGSMTIAREGLNCPALDTAVFLTLVGNWNDFTQSVGRILRELPGKKDPLAIFLVPDIGKCQKQAGRIRGFARRKGWKTREER